jgi:serine/threonine protein kinase
VEGNTLGYWLQAQTRRWREVLDVYVAAGRGLVAAQAAGLVHRDFKPDNVMITKTGQPLGGCRGNAPGRLGPVQEKIDSGSPL